MSSNLHDEEFDDQLQGNTPAWLPENLLRSLNIAFQTQLTTTSPQAPQPAAIRLPLRAHQRALIQAMEEREKASMEGIDFHSTRTYSNYGVLGDEVGSGKSLVVLGYLAAIKAKGDMPSTQNCLVRNSSKHLFTVSTKQFKDGSGGSLIVVPHTLYRQWQDYCKYQTSLKVFYAKSSKDLTDGMNKDLSGASVFLQKFTSADVVLVSNTLYSDVQYVAKEHNLKWKRMFIDEADSIHIPSTNPRPNWSIYVVYYSNMGKFYFNGSTIRPSLLEAYEQSQGKFTDDLGKWLQEEIGTKKYSGYSSGRTTWLRVRSTRWLDSYYSDDQLRAITLVKCSKEFLDESQKMPAINETVLLCEQPASHRAVASVVTGSVRNMLHAGNIEGALQELGVPADTPMNLVQAVTQEREKELKRLQKTLAFKEQMDYATPQAKEQALTALKVKIASVEAQLKTFKDRLSDIQEECPICYEDPKQNQATLTPCCHRIFCAGCVLTSLTRGSTCPMCRAELTPQKLVRLVEEKKTPKKKKEEPKLLSKPKMLLKFLKENPTARVLVFSRYENPFSSLEAGCEELGITYHTLRGNKDVIASTIKSFERGEKRVLFLPTQTAGAGLNLVSASHVVLLHAMTPEEEKQVIGRAYRLGRLNTLNVVRLLHDGETISSLA